ncbi:hypothetical protein X777_08086, partial [Ooceraea biroi]
FCSQSAANYTAQILLYFCRQSAARLCRQALLEHNLNADTDGTGFVALF